MMTSYFYNSQRDIKVGDTVMIKFMGESEERAVKVETIEWRKDEEASKIWGDLDWFFINGREVGVHCGEVEKVA